MDGELGKGISWTPLSRGGLATNPGSPEVDPELGEGIVYIFMLVWDSLGGAGKCCWRGGCLGQFARTAVLRPDPREKTGESEWIKTHAES